jgi:hypothetical protein
MKVIDLLLVMMVYKRLYCSDRGVDRTPTKQGWQRACQPSRQAPGAK